MNGQVRKRDHNDFKGAGGGLHAVVAKCHVYFVKVKTLPDSKTKQKAKTPASSL